MTLFAHHQIVPISLVTVLSVIAMIWVTNSSLQYKNNKPVDVVSPVLDEQGENVEINSCYRYLRSARTAGSSYWWQKYKSCIAAI